MDDDEDEYDTYNLSEFSAADFVYIDSTARRHEYDATTQTETSPVTSESGGPQIAVALELATDDSVVVKAAVGRSCSEEVEIDDAAQGLGERLRRRAERNDLHHPPGHKVDTRSPLEKYRRRGTLSVSDLVGPAWCELQFDYGLRQGRQSLALADRPESFVSAKGKVITVEKKVAETNDKIIGRGKSVHKELEREIFPEQVPVDVKTKEEYWAARLVNMLSCLHSLVEIGVCREMPVFGIVQDQAIVGIIDEVLLKPVSEPEEEPNSPKRRTRTSAPGTPQKSKKPRKSSPSQSELTNFFPSPNKDNVPESASPPPHPVGNELSILDTKTRRSNLLPSDDDAYSSRMQLMLYYYLLTALLASTSPFNAFWGKVGADPFAKLSDAFLLQCGLADESDGKVVQKYFSSLDDLTNLWHATLCSMHVCGLSPTLEVVYRTQPKPRGKLDDFAAADREARDIARAIASSMNDNSHDPDLERAIAESLKDMVSATDADDGGALVLFAANYGTVVRQDTRAPWYAREGVTEETESNAWGVIGRAAPPNKNLHRRNPKRQE
ncbi:exonuclease V a 5' deoxyribonuclease-domain-containing protein [Lactarius quietus]|nr:exonuclease V a 5' deoxyribonuclease-domain-containing protein [Lactarius quietus]